MVKPVKIGNAQGFWGDQPGAAARLLSQQPDLDYLTLDYLAEVSLSIMAAQREKDPERGYAADFVEVVRSLIPHWEKGSQVKVVANAGGLNPHGCAQACLRFLRESSRSIKVAVVSGDDVLSILQADPTNSLYRHLETGQSLEEVRESLVTANAYLGAKQIADALRQGADLVITGRVADPSLTVGPCLAHFNWDENQYDHLAGATIAGHLIECGTQVTGGISTHWLNMEDPAHLGFPIVEVAEDGSCVVTKPLGTGGAVDVFTVKEQLLYEIGDPERYLSPDATVSFMKVQVTPTTKDHVCVQGARGSPPPSTLKVSATYRHGYRAEGLLTFFGSEVEKKARRCGEILLQRVKDAGFELQNTLIECLGTGDVVPLLNKDRHQPIECVLRVAASDSNKESLECFVREIASLVTSGPQGVTGYTSGRPHIRPIFSYWPCLIELSRVKPLLKLIES
jgi:Acyclic terpene utilisation family protein AtuA